MNTQVIQFINFNFFTLLNLWFQFADDTKSLYIYIQNAEEKPQTKVDMTYYYQMIE